MEGALAVSKSSVRSIAATIGVVLALIAGVLGGYWLRGEIVRPTSGVTSATLSPASATRHAAVERAEAESDSALEASFAASVIKHAQAERAETGP